MNWKRRPVVGLALGGGGARGLAHIGVLKVFERHSIPVACLAGASMGGILAAAYARGLSATDLETEALNMAQMPNLIKLVDFKPPRKGLLEGSRVREYLADIVGHSTVFEALRLPLVLVAVDIDRGQEVILSAGALHPAVLASMAFPGVFPPVEIGGRRLVDGGVLNNVPADALPPLGAEVVIAVDVGARPGSGNRLKQSPWFGFLADMWEAELIMTSALVAQRLKQAHPDLVIRPSIPKEVSIFIGFQQRCTFASENV